MAGADDEYEERLTLLGAMRWFRDSFAAWFATAWLYIILWAVVGLAFFVLLYIDAVFSRGLAPESINPLSFQGMGIAYRLFAAAFMMAAARCVYKGIKGRWTFRALGAFASVIVCLHAFGFGFEALSDRREQAMAVREIAETKATGSADLIAALQARKATIDADTKDAVANLDAEITQYITDGRNNDDLADGARARRNALQDKATAEKADIDAEIMALMREASTGKVASVEATTEAKPWAPLFVGIAQLVTWSKEPTDWSIYLCAVGFIVLWVLLGESLVIFLPERIYLMHLKDAEGKQTVPAAKEGEVIIKMTEQEAAEMQAALAAYGKRREGDIKGGETRQRKNRQDAKRIEANQYMEKRKENVLRKRRTGASLADIAKGLGVTPAVLGLEMRQWMSDAEYAFVFENGPDPQGDTDENLAARA